VVCQAKSQAPTRKARVLHRQDNKGGFCDGVCSELLGKIVHAERGCALAMRMKVVAP